MTKPNRILTPEILRRCLTFCLLPALVFYVVSLLIMALSGFSMIEILRDPAQQTGESSFLGFVSTIGTWVWLGGAVICGFRVAIWGPGHSDHKTLLKLAGWFSLVLAVDDYFLIHDRYLTEAVLIPAYALFLAYLLKRFWPRIVEIDALAVLTAGGMLFASVVVDAVQENLPIPYGASQVLEEGFKFLGAAAWAYFCFRIAAYGLKAQSQP